jgi:hypothetical protein
VHQGSKGPWSSMPRRHHPDDSAQVAAYQSQHGAGPGAVNTMPMEPIQTANRQTPASRAGRGTTR